jgi:hypothetical protein
MIVLLPVVTTDAAAPGAAITTVLLLPFAVGVLAVPMLELMDDEFCAFAACRIIVPRRKARAMETTTTPVKVINEVWHIMI